MKIAKLAGFERGSQTRGVNTRAPEAFVRVDVAHASQNALIEQEGLDAGTAAAQFRGEFLFCGLERIEAEFAQHGFALAILDDSHASEAANVGVAQLAAIVEGEKDVSVRHHRRFRWANDKLTRHSQMNEQRGAGVIGARRFEIQHEKFSMSADGGDATTGEALLEGGRIVDEIRFAKANGENSPSGEHGSQAARNGFYFREFGHGRDWTLAHRIEMQNSREERKAKGESRRGGPVVKKNLFEHGWGVC